MLYEYEHDDQVEFEMWIMHDNKYIWMMVKEMALLVEVVIDEYVYYVLIKVIPMGKLNHIENILHRMKMV